MKQSDNEVRIWLIAGVILALGLSVTFVPMDFVGAQKPEEKRVSSTIPKPDRSWKVGIKRACFQFVDNKPDNAEPKTFNLDLSAKGNIEGFKEVFCECLAENYVRLLQKKRETDPGMDVDAEARFFQVAYSVPKPAGARRKWVKRVSEGTKGYFGFMKDVQNGCNQDKAYKAPLNLEPNS